jgi:hypothetical protein
LVPEEKLCVVVQANVTRRWPRAVTESVTNAILSTLLGGKPDDFPTLLPDPPPKTPGLPGMLEGKWAGRVYTHQGNLELTLWCGHKGHVLAQLGEQAETSIRDAHLNGAGFTGKMDGRIGTDDARRRPQELEWNVTLRGDVLNGTPYATTKTTRPLRLGYWVEMRQVEPTSPNCRAGVYRRHGLDPMTQIESRVRRCRMSRSTGRVCLPFTGAGLPRSWLSSPTEDIRAKGTLLLVNPDHPFLVSGRFLRRLSTRMVSSSAKRISRIGCGNAGAAIGRSPGFRRAYCSQAERPSRIMHLAKTRLCDACLHAVSS